MTYVFVPDVKNGSGPWRRGLFDI